MLGAEGVKRLLIRRFKEVMPTALEVRRALTGATVADLPDVKRWYPTAVPDVPAGLFPFATVTVEGTNGELSNEMDTSDFMEHEFTIEYTVLLTLWTMVNSQAGDAQARLQVERLALAARETALQSRELTTDAEKDSALVNYARWVEEYDITQPDNTGAWLASATLQIPVLATEYLDRAPYLPGNLAVLRSHEQDRVTLDGTQVPGPPPIEYTG